MENFRKKIEEIKENPSEQVWQNIEKQLPKKVFPFKTLAISGLTVLVASILFVVLSPEKNQSPIQKNKTKEEKIIPSFEQNKSKFQFTQIENAENQSNSRDGNLANNETEKVISASYPQIVVAEVEEQIANNTTQQNTTKKESNKQETASKKTPKLIVESNGKTTETKSSIAENELINQGNLFVPNAFTPEESQNNIFKPAYRDLQSYEMQIYSRNGKQVFATKDINEGWNGKVNGSYAQQGVYAVIIKYIDLNGKQYTQNVQLMLIR